MDLNLRVNIDLEKSTNYISMGFWSETADYYLSDMGIPFVKKPDGSTIGYSVYALKVQQAMKGSWVSSEWRLLESAEFIYMQEAYIERLQTLIVKAEIIESLMIKTSNLEVLNGSKIGNFQINNGILTSSYQWMTYVGPNLVIVTSNIEIRSSGVKITSSYGGTMDHPQVVTWYAELSSTSITMGSMEMRRDGIYRNGIKVL